MKTIELTKEELEELLNRKSGEIIFGNLDVKVKKKAEQWEPKGGEYYVTPAAEVYTVSREYAIYNKMSQSGTVFKSFSQAESAAKKMRTFNRLLAYVDEFDPEYEFNIDKTNFYIELNHAKTEYQVEKTYCYENLSTVYMSKEVAKELCRKLNSGDVVL